MCPRLLGFFRGQKGAKMKQYEHYFFDLDGTLINGEGLLPYAKELISCLRKQKKQVFFLTNHPVRSRRVLTNDLQELGLDIFYDELITPIMGLKEYFAPRNKDSRKLYVAGSKMIKEELREQGFTVVDEHASEEPKNIAVVLGMTPDLTYNQLQVGFWLMQQGAELILLNGDLLCPHPKGFLIDTGSLARVLEHKDKKPVIVGKPSYWMQQALLRAMRGNVENAVIIGDSLTSDIGIGNSLNIDTVLVCSGVTSIHQMQHAVQLPTVIFPSVREIYQLIKG